MPGLSGGEAADVPDGEIALLAKDEVWLRKSYVVDQRAPF